MLRRSFLAAAAALVCSAVPAFADDKPATKKPQVEVVFCLDTTGSMGGLIEGAKQKIWSISNRDIQGYGTLSPRTMCLTPYDSSGRLLAETVLRAQYPNAYSYLLRHRDTLARRRGIGPGTWHALRSASCLTLAAGLRVMLKLICSGGDFTIDCDGRYIGHAGTLVLVTDQRQVDPLYLLGVLNNRVFWFFVRHTMPTMGEGRHVLRRSTLRRFPLVVSGSSQDARQQIATAVRGLLGIGETPPTRAQVLADIERLVAQLYGIEPAELSAEIPEI